ncbi:MAG: cupin domain-containing protein, partial [Gammaproteobacteria bacterium]|nr:cupin domain-containing protein [Gammaproteobacteria bacterium]
EEYGRDGSAWQVSTGPLTDSDFARLPETHWTLLVQDVDKHLPELQALLDIFNFIPDWRRDDLMISYATESGSVGPHTDAYDVFLLQAMGTRRWQFGDQPIHEAKLIDGLELQILSEFTPDQSWDLLPGDMLYLPPHFAHHGVAVNDCMTYSIGFRAPSAVDMLDALVNTLLEHGLGKSRYQDPDLVLNQHGAEIDIQAVARLKHMLHLTIDQAEPQLATVLGRFVTETKPGLATIAAEASTDLPDIDELTSRFDTGEVLQRNTYYRFAWTSNDKGGELFMAGESYAVGLEGVRNLPLMSETNSLSITDWQNLRHDAVSANILCQLIAEGGWFWQ